MIALCRFIDVGFIIAEELEEYKQANLPVPSFDKTAVSLSYHNKTTEEKEGLEQRAKENSILPPKAVFKNIKKIVSQIQF